MIELSDDAVRNIRDAIAGWTGGGPAHTYEAESLLNAREVIEEELANAETSTGLSWAEQTAQDIKARKRGPFQEHQPVPTLKPTPGALEAWREDLRARGLYD